MSTEPEWPDEPDWPDDPDEPAEPEEITLEVQDSILGAE